MFSQDLISFTLIGKHLSFEYIQRLPGLIWRWKIWTWYNSPFRSQTIFTFLDFFFSVLFQTICLCWLISNTRPRIEEAHLPIIISVTAGNTEKALKWLLLKDSQLLNNDYTKQMLNWCCILLFRQFPRSFLIYLESFHSVSDSAYVTFQVLYWSCFQRV